MLVYVNCPSLSRTVTWAEIYFQKVCRWSDKKLESLLRDLHAGVKWNLNSQQVHSFYVMKLP
jgi:hypothetical protein